MRKVSGWLLVVTGGGYPLMLILFWALGLFTLTTTGRIIGLEHLIGLTRPFIIAVSLLLLFAGVKLIWAREIKEANNADGQR